MHIKQLLSTCLQSNNWRMQLLKNWPTVVGTLSNKVSIEKIEGSTLTLGVNDSCWLQELYMMSSLLLTTINQTLDQPYIKQLRFKKAGYTQRLKKINGQGASCAIKQIHLNNAERYALEQITNLELRQALEAFCIRCHRERS